MERVAVILIVFAAIVWLVRMLTRSSKSPLGGCSCCSGCTQHECPSRAEQSDNNSGDTHPYSAENDEPER
ncbi:MAG: FeoB-associated Cys-rich membrane protein [Phycisphaerae bacterium]